MNDVRVSTCRCGTVRCEGRGRPILSAVCYCDDCQRGGAMLEALEGAPPVLTPDGGTHFLTWRDDRFACVAGVDRLDPIKLAPDAPTERIVARCCNSAMYLKFGKGHWTSSYAVRFDDIPPVEMRTQTQHRSGGEPMPDDARVYRGFGLRLFWRLFTSRIAMFFG